MIKVAMLHRHPLHESQESTTLYADRLSHYLSQTGEVEVHVITSGYEDKQFRQGNLYIHVIGKRRYDIPILHPIEVWKKVNTVKQINPDIVNAQAANTPSVTTALFTRGRHPTILTMLAFLDKELRFWEGLSFIIGMLIFKPLIKYAVKKTPNIIVETSSIKSLVSEMTKSRIYVVPNGIEFEEVQQIQPGDLKEKPDILLVAGLERIKGVDILLKSIPIVLKSVPNLKVYIAGSGSQEGKLKNLVKRLKLEEHVEFLGFISTEEKFKYYRRCKIVVVPSRWDAMPTTLLEAMASGKPVVASAVGGIPDTIVDGKTGLLFESENAEDLADKIVKLLTDESLRKEMGQAAVEKAKECDWGKIAERTVGVYKEAIADFYKKKRGIL